MVDRSIQPGGLFRIRPQVARDYLTRGEERKPRPPAPHVREVADPTAPPGSEDRTTLSAQGRAAWRDDPDRSRAAVRAFEQGHGADRRPLPVAGPGRPQDARLPDAGRPVADRARPLANGPPSALARVEKPGFRPGERGSGRDPGRGAGADRDPGELPPGCVDVLA